MAQLLLVFSQLCSLIIGVCATAPPNKGTYEDANYDERSTTISLAGVDTLTSAVGLEDGLFYNSWVLIKDASAHSQPNAILTTIFQQTLNGTAYMTVKYPGSKYKAFDLESFWFYCRLTNPEGELDAPVECAVLVAGFRDGQEVASASYTFTPTVPQLLVPPMVEAVLPGTFSGLDNITLIPSDPELQSLHLDNVEYVLHT